MYKMVIHTHQTYSTMTSNSCRLFLLCCIDNIQYIVVTKYEYKSQFDTFACAFKIRVKMAVYIMRMRTGNPGTTCTQRARQYGRLCFEIVRCLEFLHDCCVFYSSVSFIMYFKSISNTRVKTLLGLKKKWTWCKAQIGAINREEHFCVENIWQLVLFLSSRFWQLWLWCLAVSLPSSNDFPVLFKRTYVCQIAMAQS